MSVVSWSCKIVVFIFYLVILFVASLPFTWEKIERSIRDVENTQYFAVVTHYTLLKNMKLGCQTCRIWYELQWKHKEYWINTCLLHFHFAVFTLSGNETVFTHPIPCDVVSVRQPTVHTLYLLQISDCNWWCMGVYISRQPSLLDVSQFSVVRTPVLCDVNQVHFLQNWSWISGFQSAGSPCKWLFCIYCNFLLTFHSMNYFRNI